MTRRERLQRKLERREEWAEKRVAKSSRRFDAAHRELQGLTPGQPILVGHYSEKRHRAHLARVDSNMRKGVEHSDMAAHHRSKAGGLARQLDNSIFSDDDDAIERLKERIADREAQRDRMKEINRIWTRTRKGGAPSRTPRTSRRASARAYGAPSRPREATTRDPSRPTP